MGQLGDNGTIGHSVTPVVVSLPAGVSATKIAAGSEHSLAIGSDGKLYVWGYNEYGQLGNGGAVNLKTPAAISLAAGVSATAIAGGEDHSLAIGSNGAVYAWGYNANGQLGNGGTTQTNTPVEVSLPASSLPATAIFAGSLGQRQHRHRRAGQGGDHHHAGHVGLDHHLRPVADPHGHGEPDRWRRVGDLLERRQPDLGVRRPAARPGRVPPTRPNASPRRSSRAPTP